MSKRKAFPLRLNETMLSALQRWAEDELRSVNSQIEYALREQLKRSGRWPPPGGDDDAEQS